MTSYHLARGTFCALAVLAAIITANCGEWVPDRPAPVNSPVIPLSSEEAGGELSLPSRQGVVPCGVFNVNGFGHKTVSIADFPGCKSAHYDVMCLDRIGRWRGAHISDVATSADANEVTFTSAQDGICGLFPN